MAENNGKGFLGNFFKSLDLRDIIVAGMLVPLGTEVIAPMGKDLLAKLFSQAGKAVGDKFGLNTEEAKKGVEDNIAYGKMRFDLPEGEVKKLFEFEKKLRSGEDGDNRFAALVLYVVKGITSLKKETSQGGGKNKNGSNKNPIKVIDDAPGVEWAKKFFKQLLSFPTYEEQIAYLQHEDVFTLIKKEKETIDLLKEAIKLKDGVVAAGKKFLETAVESLKRTDEKIEKSTTSYEERARARFEASKTRRP
ncbi:MAG: hypothetical protein HGA61_04970 [Candidatus Moranbacteria bacterium]|nr:hypothetical protein [Candidatus Moranbacteria bacterium]